jgi:hypothetical protein
MSTVVIQSHSAGAVVIQAYDAGTLVEAQATDVPTLPSFLTHAFEYAGIAGAVSDPVASWVCSITGDSATQATGANQPAKTADSALFTANDFLNMPASVRTSLASAGAVFIHFGSYTYGGGKIVFNAQNGTASFQMSMNTQWRLFLRNTIATNVTMATGDATDNAACVAYARYSVGGTGAVGEDATESTGAAPGGTYGFIAATLGALAGGAAGMTGNIKAVYVTDVNPSPAQIAELLAYVGTP